MVLISRFLVPKGYNGLTVYPFVFLKRTALKGDIVLINHENIHLKQQLELLILPFFLWYLFEYIFRLFQYKNRFLAYRNISFEREAYANHANFNYISERKFWNFLKYL